MERSGTMNRYSVKRTVEKQIIEYVTVDAENEQTALALARDSRADVVHEEPGWTEMVRIEIDDVEEDY